MQDSVQSRSGKSVTIKRQIINNSASANISKLIKALLKAATFIVIHK